VEKRSEISSSQERGEKEEKQGNGSTKKKKKENLSVGLEGLFDVLEIRHINERRLESHGTSNTVKEAVSSSIHVVDRDDMITGLEHAGNRRGASRSRSEGESFI